MIVDSGNRTEFDSGAVRDIQKGKGRCDLLPLATLGTLLDDMVLSNIGEFICTGNSKMLWCALLSFEFSAYPETQKWDYATPRATTAHMLLETAIHFEEGAEKYGENNWQKGLPVKSFINSSVRHYLKWLRGDDDERHDRAFCWNILCALWTCENKPELNEYGNW